MSDKGSRASTILMLGPSLKVQGGITSVEKLILKHQPDEIKIIHIPTFVSYFNFKTLIPNLFVFGTAIFRLAFNLLVKNIAVIHIHFAEKGSTVRKTILIRIASLFRVSIIIHSHGAAYEEYFNNLSPSKQDRIKNAFLKTERLLVLSESWKDFYIKNLSYPANKITVLNNPIELPQNLPTNKTSETIHFVFLGQIGQRKGTFDLIKACSKLDDNTKQRVKITIAGDGDVEKAKTMVQKYGLEKQIEIKTWINEDERDQLFRGAHAFILPSYNEGLPMSMLEAMSYGLAIITTPVGGIPEVIVNKNNGILVEPGAVDAIAQSIEVLIKDADMRVNLSKNARETALNFDISKYTIELEHIYTKVIEK